MIIEELTLKNFKSHKNSKIQFTDDISVILGQNGAGKSTLLEAIRFALFKKVDGNIGDLVRKPVNAEDNVSTMSVILRFKHNGIHYVLERTKKRSSNVSQLTRLSNGKSVQITKGEKEVTSEIEKIIGVDKNSFLNAVYIKQGEITSLIDKTASDRKELISKLLNLDNLEKSWKNMVDIIKEYEGKKELNDRYLDDKDKILEKRKENEENIVKITEEIETDTKSKEELNEELEKLKKEVELLNQKKEQFEKNNLRAESLKKTIDENKNQLNKEQEHLERIKFKEKENIIIEKEIIQLPQLNKLVEIKDKSNDAKNKLAELEQNINRITQLQQVLKDTKNDYEKSKEYTLTLDELNKRQEMLKDDVEELKKLESSLKVHTENKENTYNWLNKKAGEARRILNNQKLRNAEEISKEYNIQLEQQEQEHERINDEINKCKQEISSNNTIIKNTKKSLSDLQNTTDKCPICQSDISHEKHESLLKNYSNTIEECETKNIALQEDINKKQADLKVIDDKIKEIRTIEANSMINEYEKFKKDLKEIKSIESQIESFKDKNEEYKLNDEKIRELTADIKKLEANKQSYITTEATLKELKDINELKNEQNSVIEQINEYTNQIKEILQKVPIKDDIKAQIKYLENREKEYNENKGFISNKEDTIKKIKEMTNKLTEDNNNLDNLNRENRELSYDQEIHEKTSETYRCKDEKFIEIDKKLVENKTKKEGYKKERINIQENIEKLEKIETEQVALNDYIKLLKNIRELYGKDGVQRELRENSKPQIELETNNIFNDFNFDYDNIHLDENYEISINKSNETLNVSMLSGGEKIVVALALRLAIAKVISKQKNQLLILDEPTVHLDEERKLELIEILRDADIADQMLIVTHDPDLMGISENVVEIRKKNGVSEYVQNE